VAEAKKRARRSKPRSKPKARKRQEEAVDAVPIGRLILEFLQAHPNAEAAEIAAGIGSDEATVAAVLSQRVIIA
jgi:hypothetical protein